MAYVVVSRTDPTADRLPQLTLEMQFEDQTGPVTLVLPSNTPPIAVTANAIASPTPRAAQGLQVTQVVDPRDARDGEKDRTVKLEVICRGKGAVPDLRELLDGLDQAIEGYRIEEKGIEPKPTVVTQEGVVATTRYYWGPPKPPEGGYPERDADGLFRLNVERSWVVTYTPAGGSLGGEFRVPSLRNGVQATLVSRYFSDMDLVPATGGIVPVNRRSWLLSAVSIAALIAVIAAAALVWRRLRTRTALAPAGFPLPQRVTPLSAVTMLRRIAVEYSSGLEERRRGDLERDIALIEQRYFGPGENPPKDGELGEMLQRWSAIVRA
jgi:hypothetical protein